MTTQQNEALRLVDALLNQVETNDDWSQEQVVAAAAKLQRQQIDNDALGVHLSERMNDLTRVEAQRDALLEAMQSIADCCDEEHAARDYTSRQTEIRGIARAAIKAVEENT